jgi:23S rRNA pseudouridine1911/1915/1917 synthase
MEQSIRLKVTQGGERVDKYVAGEVASLSRSQIQDLIARGLVTVNGSEVKPSQRLKQGDSVGVIIPPLEEVELVPEPMPLRIVYEDEDLVAVDKPPGLVVHPAAGHRSGTLLNALLARYPDLPLDEEKRPGIVHRLDKDTSGLILVARSQEAQENLQAQFRAREVLKVYLSLVEGIVEPRNGVIDAPIGRDARERKRMAVVQSGGRPAVTEFRVLEQLGEYTLLEVRPKTGRTHQVRVHLAFLGHPVVGDSVYGRRKQRLGLERQFLHAHRLAFRHPSSGDKVDLVSELPADLESVLDQLRGPNLISAEEWERFGPPS